MSRFSCVSGLWLLVLLFSLQVMDAYTLWPWGKSASEGSAGEATKDSSKEKPGGGPVLGSTKRKGTGTGTARFPYDVESAAVLGGPGARGKQLYEQSTALMSGNACWQQAYSGLAANCRDILRDESHKSKLALRLTDCFLRTSGRGGLKKCAEGWPIASCVKALDDHTHAIFLAFYIDAAAMCHYLQSQEFKIETEKLVNELKMSAHNTENKLDTMSEELEEQHELIIQRSEHILDVQKRLQKEHALLQTSIEEGMENLQVAADQAQEQLNLLNQYQQAIADKQQELAESLAMELQELQVKSNVLGRSMVNLHGSVEDLTEKSAAGQEEAMRSLTELQQLQLDSIKESRKSMRALAEEAKQHQEEFRGWQSELDNMHQRLVEGSTLMIKSQEMFVNKQAAVFTTMEKLFSLHNAILLESRAVKTVMLYFALSIFVFMATTTKQTRGARLLLYFGLFWTLTFEIWTIRFTANEEMSSNSARFIWPPRSIVLARYLYGFLASAYLIYTFFTYRDYEALNYKMLKEMYGNFGHQTRLQEKLLQEYLARCENCKDIPQPNALDRKNPDYQSAEEGFDETPSPPSRRTRSTRSQRNVASPRPVEERPAPRSTRRSYHARRAV